MTIWSRWLSAIPRIGGALIRAQNLRFFPGGPPRRWSAFSVVIVALAFALSLALDVTGRPARAGSLNPSPATATPIPGGYTNISAGTPSFVVNVTPNPALFIPQGNCSRLLCARAGRGPRPLWFGVDRGA
jgi:hypothetical protein